MLSHAHRLILGLLLCALALSSCSQGKAPDELRVATPTASASAGSPNTSPTASPTAPTPPRFPETAIGNSDEAGAAFIRYYIDMLGYAEQTGDVKPLKPLGMPTCETCNAIIRGFRSIHRDGGYFEGSSRTVRWTKGGMDTGQDIDAEVVTYTYKIRVDHTGYVAAGDATSTPTSHPAGSTDYRFDIVRYRDEWRITTWSKSG